MAASLKIYIPEKPPFYTLYAQGLFNWKSFDRIKRVTVFEYPANAVIALYYSYPSYREVSVIRNTENDDGIMLPALSKKVSVLFSLRASRFDKLRRAISFLNEHTEHGAYSFDDGFYTRLYFLLLQRGKINYTALKQLIAHSYEEKKIC
ncbi:MAG: hypothetical protein Ta2A_07830 [Treponemataceae bacterium]|nr:MAG: hypothetical protein Ta2A_07830 [Treponemataceae bacterium]